MEGRMEEWKEEWKNGRKNGMKYEREKDPGMKEGRIKREMD